MCPYMLFIISTRGGVPRNFPLPSALRINLQGDGLHVHDEYALSSYQLFVCLLVCWVIYFKVASILAAYLRYTRLRHPNHPSPAMPAYLHFTREVRRVFKE